MLEETSPQGVKRFEYNPLGQQVKVTTHDGQTLVNRYDAENLRVEMEENQKLTRFIFHKGEILVETDEKDTPISRFTRGYDVVASDIVNEESGETACYYYQLDEQRSTAFITREDGKVENFYVYDAFGNVLESKETLHNRITYTNQQFDPIATQYYLRARYYNPVIGRFTQEDVYRGDGLNLYAYCGNNPVRYYDPSGYAKNGNACGDKEDQVNSNDGTETPKTYNVNEKELTQSEFNNLRRNAVRKAWKQEGELVRKTGKGTRNWTTSEIDELLTTGKVKGYEGQHMKSAEAYPDFAGSPENIQFLKGRTMDVNEHLDAHLGNYQNKTNWYYDPETMVYIDFGEMIPWND